MDTYTIKADGPAPFSVQPFVVADANGHATVLAMSDIDQTIGPYTLRFTTERTGAVTQIDFNVGATDVFNPAKNSGETIADPTEQGPMPTINLDATPPNTPPIMAGWTSPWVIAIGVLGIIVVAVMGWFARD